MAERLKAYGSGADHPGMRAIVLGVVAVLGGTVILASGLLDRSTSADAATVIGELMALAVGALLLAAGTRALVRHR
jgi:hypothetical protein